MRIGFAARGSAAGIVDLGREPPLTVDQRGGVPQRRSVSLRWLTGTVLTGVTSIGLMGGALMAALDGRHQLAFPPEQQHTLLGDAAAALANGHKGDRIRAVHEQVADRQVLQVSTVTKQQDRDIIKLKPFAKITTTLATSISQYAGQIPAFDPIKIAAAGAKDEPAPQPDVTQDDTSKDLGVVNDEGTSGDDVDASATDAAAGSGDSTDASATDSGSGGPAAPTGDQLYGANVQGEVSVKVSAFPMNEIPAAGDLGMTTAEAEELVRRAMVPEANGAMPRDGVQIAANAYVDPERFNPSSSTDPLSPLGVSIVPENVSFVSKTTATNSSDERIATVDRKKSLVQTLQDNDVSADDAANISKALAELIDLSGLHAGQKIRILLSDTGNATEVERVSIYDQGVHQATVARRDDGSFVRADEPETSTDEFDTTDQPQPSDGDMPKVYDSIYETALEQKVPLPLVNELIRIFSYDVDLQAPISPGDGLEVFHSLPDAGGSDADDEILYAALTIDGVTKRYYRYRSPDDGVVDYFDENGRSAKKFLVRKPISVGYVTSPFGYRKHPILGFVRLHPGVDWGAPRGTPITAAGNGVVEKAGWSTGYGNFTLVRHTNGYETAYGHQSVIAKGIRPGVRVRQGQIIGYVGSTGLSTGSHLHYEVRINGKPVDPLRVRLPRGRDLQGDALVAFEAEKNRIDTLIGAPAGANVAAIGDGSDTSGDSSSSDATN